MGSQLHRNFSFINVGPQLWQRIKQGNCPHSFPNAVPTGTCVPQWALIDVTVHCSLDFPTCTNGTQLQDDWSLIKLSATGGRDPPSPFVGRFDHTFFRHSQDRSRHVNRHLSLGSVTSPAASLFTVSLAVTHPCLASHPGHHPLEVVV